MPALISVEQQILDAAQIITNPPLIYSAQNSESSVFFEFDSSLKKDFTSNIEKHIVEHYDFSRHFRLGLYYEHLLKNIFACSTKMLIAHHKVIQNEERTLGEIDFLLNQTKTKPEITHLEVAYKVYAITGNAWRGPNPEDTLTTKVQHLFTKQLQMHLKFPKAWHNAALSMPSRTKALIQGRLFLPFRERENQLINDIMHFKVNSVSAVSGIWCHRKDFTAYSEQTGQEYWQCLDKTSWISAKTTNSSVHFKEIESLVAPNQSVILKPCANKETLTTAKTAQQNNLVLFLPNEWPKIR